MATEQRIVKVEGTQVLEIGVDKAVQSDKNGKLYYRARYQGNGFIIDEDTFGKFETGDIAQFILKESSYEIEDPMDPTQKITRPSWQVISTATYEQLTKIEAQQGKLAIGRKRFDVEIAKLEKEAMADVKLETKDVAKLADAV